MSSPNVGVNVRNSMDCTECCPRSCQSSCMPNGCCGTECDDSSSPSIEVYPSERDAEISHVAQGALGHTTTVLVSDADDSCDSPLRPRCVIL